MTKHFEDLWNSSEEVSKLFYSDPLNIISKQIKEDLDLLVSVQDQNERIEAMGSILLHLSYISDHLNINVYAALKNQLDELKSALYDPSED